MNPDRIVSDFRQRQLSIDFMQMSLVQNGAVGGGAISYEGKGYIKQSDDDKLAFKLYASKVENTDLTRDFNRLNETTSGQLYSADDFYTLSGVASDGSVWKAERVLPHCDWNAQFENPVVRGGLSSISGGELAQGPKSIALHFFDKADLPVLIDKANFKAAGCEFRVENSEASFTVRAKSEDPLPDYFAMRIEEALRFLLAQSVSPRAIIQPRAITLNSTTLKSPLIRLGPPISRGSAAFVDRSWDLFDAYLSYVMREGKFENWHPCTGHLHNAMEASANSLDAWAVGLGVAVEGLASMIEMKLDKARSKARAREETKLRNLQKLIVKEVSKRKTYKDSTDRIRGILAGLTEVRAIDRMKWLAGEGGLDPKHIDAWRKLRNRGVHPKAKGDLDIASLDFQKALDDLHRVNVLLYHIVFHLIGYRGPFTDYGELNFPTREYPSEPAKT